MASLYTHKESNIRRTYLIFALFFSIVIAIGWTFSQIYGNPSILIVAVVFSSLMSIISYWFSDKIILRMTRAVPIDMKNNPELYRIVENLCITAGLPMPKIYLVPERQPNAFATGRDPEHAVIAVTAGLLERLDRSELEGVLAHELSHIGNRDMLVSTVSVILFGFISILADMSLRSMWWGGGQRGNNRKGGNGLILIIGIALPILAILAALVARLMHLAISRRREFLADTSGALLTRYPEGLAKALIKISSDPTPMAVASNTTAHLWFDDPFDNPKRQTPLFHKLFMTHPPVEERVRALKEMSL